MVSAFRTIHALESEHLCLQEICHKRYSALKKISFDTFHVTYLRQNKNDLSNDTTFSQFYSGDTVPVKCS
jgi:hypothetical protein